MSTPNAEQLPLPLHPRRTPAFRLPRRRRLPTVRLGGRRVWGSGLVRAFRRIRLRWLAARYRRILKRMKVFYSGLVRDLIEGTAAMEAMQSRMMMEAYFSVPVLPVSVKPVGQHRVYY